MKAIVNTGPGRLEWLDVPLPEPGLGQARVRTLAVGICATDLDMIDGWERTGFPSTPGHEWSGEVDAVGAGVDASLIGARCVAENVLRDGGEVGFEHPGGYGEYLITEAAKLKLLPDDFDPATAALIEPLAVCVRGMRRARLMSEATASCGGHSCPPSSALVTGDGPIGLIMTILLSRAGVASITLVGGREPRLALGREFGAATTINYHECPSIGGEYALVVEASGSVTGMKTALDVAAAGARVLVLGDYGDGRADYAWSHLLHRELELIGSNASAEAWPEAVRLAIEERLPLERLISERLPAAEFAEAFELVRTSRDVLKLVLTW